MTAGIPVSPIHTFTKAIRIHYRDDFDRNATRDCTSSNAIHRTGIESSHGKLERHVPIAYNSRRGVKSGLALNNSRGCYLIFRLLSRLSSEKLSSRMGEWRLSFRIASSVRD